MRALTMEELTWVVGGQTAPGGGGSPPSGGGSQPGGGGSQPDTSGNNVPDVGARVGEAIDNPATTIGKFFDAIIEFLVDDTTQNLSNMPGPSHPSNPQPPQPPTGPYSGP